MNESKVHEIYQQLLREGMTSRHLADAVIDAAAERASSLNCEGLEAQIAFLLQGGDHSQKPHEILFAAAESARLDSRHPIASREDTGTKRTLLLSVVHNSGLNKWKVEPYRNGEFAEFTLECSFADLNGELNAKGLTPV